MKKLILLFTIIVFSYNVNAQCSPLPIFTSLGIPGVYPPSVPIPNSPLPLGILDGAVGSQYTETLTLVVLEDTTMDIASLLDPAIAAAIQAAGISTMMALDVNHVIFDVSGLPNGLSSTCDQGNCQYSSGIDGCILISGTPLQGGNFQVPVNMIINVQIPAIPPFLSSMAIDLPSLPVVEYDLFISGGTAVSDFISSDFVLFPNPTSNTATLNLKTTSDVKIYNVIGDLVSSYSSVRNNITLSKSDLGIGMFYVSIITEHQKEIIRLIVK